MADHLIRGNRVLLPTGVGPAVIHVRGDRIVSVGPGAGVAPGAPVFDAGDLLVTPGVVDPHVHINEPGRTEWEGFRTATEAAAAGGITTVVDMPLNSIPATTSAGAAEAKRASLEGQIAVDVRLWGGVVPGNAADLEGLARFGVAGCKCFLCPSGVDEFPHVGRADLERALPVMRDLGLTLLVHAEAPGPLERAELAVHGQDPHSYLTYLASRPKEAEDQAIAMMIELAREHRARVHIVHLSSASALPMLARAQQDGVDITAETCLHYLTFEAEQIADGATHFKCAPPIREHANRELLWQGLADGTISMVVSDHSPCTPGLKAGDFMGAWGGIASLQLGLSALWTEASARGHTVEEMFRWNATHTARLAGLTGRKGAIAAGHDADLVVWDDRASFTVAPADILHRHKLTPYAGRTLRGVVQRTYLRGALAYSRTAGLTAPRGALLTNSREM